MTQAGDTVQTQGSIKRQGITTYMYGTHILVDQSEETLYALKSSTLDLDKYIGKYVEVSGTLVPGYPLEGGPPYLDVGQVQEMTT